MDFPQMHQLPLFCTKIPPTFKTPTANHTNHLLAFFDCLSLPGSVHWGS